MKNYINKFKKDGFVVFEDIIKLSDLKKLKKIIKKFLMENILLMLCLIK